MDGRKEQLGDSLQYRLSMLLCISVAVLALAAGALSFLFAFDEAIELQDDQLRQMGLLLAKQHQPVANQELKNDRPDADPESNIILQVLNAPPGADPLPIPPAVVRTLKDGIQTADIGADSWRLFVRSLPSGQQVAIAQRTEVRDEIARYSALRTVAPLIILVPILLMLMNRLIRRMFGPMRAMADRVRRQGQNDLAPLPDAALPAEIRPFVAAINALFARISETLSAQRRFIADAAHELRSPLTALSLQAERLQRVDMPGPAAERLDYLRAGIERTRSLLEQLLALARLQEGSQGQKMQAAPVSVHAVFQNVLEQLMPLADAKHLDIGVVGSGDGEIIALGVELETMIKNLVDNAIRYTPEQGRIDLSVAEQQDGVTICISDTGPGISEAQRQRVFDPFYRVMGSGQPGSGLGLSIVKTIADKLGATITLKDVQAQAPNGLRVEIFCPSQVAGLSKTP